MGAAAVPVDDRAAVAMTSSAGEGLYVMDREMDTPPVVSPEEWNAAREQLLVKEKELTRARDTLYF